MPVIACLPKSGSTYLMRLLCEATGMVRQIPIVDAEDTEHVLDSLALERLRYKNGIVQQHLRATRRHLKLLAVHRLKPVVLTRSLSDIVVSLNDHFERESRFFPTGFVPQDFLDWPETRRLDFIIETHLQWMLHFVLSWQEASDTISIHFLTYEQLVSDTPGTLAALADFWDLRQMDSVCIERAIQTVLGQPDKTRFNRGHVGRGQRLTADQLARIKQLVDQFPLDSTTLQRLGLHAS